MVADLIERLNKNKEEFSLKKGRCLEIFEEKVKEGEVHIDLYFTARALSSLCNTIANRKIEYMETMMDAHLQLLGFLHTFDDNYLSNMTNVLDSELSTEINYLSKADEDLKKIYCFLSSFLDTLKDSK